MESDNLYRVQEEDLPRLQKLLTVCFAQDPLYHTLIPDDDTRERLLPELFSCDLTEFFQTCEIYSDSSELNSILVKNINRKSRRGKEIKCRKSY